MPDVVGIRFRKAGKVYFFDPKDLKLEIDARVVVETIRGMELGWVAVARRHVCDAMLAPYLPLKDIIRSATEKDLETWETFRQKAHDAYQVCQDKIKQHHLDMKLLDAEYTFDGAKLIFQFTAEGRVDFRELVRDLAAVFRTRIELRQVGVRDEAKMIGGIGGCGRELCCCNFLGDFLPVSIKMARDQNLSLNPAKISGVCGRLLCCLNYEHDEYGLTTRRTDPFEIGALVEGREGRGRVISVNQRQNLVKVKLLENGEVRDLLLDDVILIEE